MEVSCRRNEEEGGSGFYESSEDDGRSCSHKEGSHEMVEALLRDGYAPCGLCCRHNERVEESCVGFYKK